MKKNLREQLRSQPLPEDELSEKEQHLLQHLLDRDLEKKWSMALAEKGVHRDAPRFSIHRFRPWLVAAAVMMAGAFGWWLWISQQPDAQRMAETYLQQPFALNDDLRDGSVTDEPQRARSLQAYRNADYQTALNSVTPLLAEGRAGDYFIAGLSNLYLSRYRDAAGCFEKAREIDPVVYNDEINWHLGLIYVMLDDREKATASLNKVIDSKSSRNREQARLLLESLSK